MLVQIDGPGSYRAAVLRWLESGAQAAPSRRANAIFGRGPEQRSLVASNTHEAAAEL